MRLPSPRPGRWPLALTATALAVLAACADEPTATSRLSTTAAPQQLGTGPVILVTNTNGSANVEGSLPWAFSQITSDAVIRFDPGLAGATITPDLTLRADSFVTIEGPASGLTISGGDVRPVLNLRAGGRVRNLTLTKGEETAGSGVHGGTGPLWLEHTTVVGNRGTAVYGKDITLVNSTVSGNVALSSTVASGIAYHISGRLTLINSTVAFNSNAPGIGAAGAPGPIPTVVLENSIISNNAPTNCRDVLGFQYQGMNLSNDTTCGNAGAIVVLNPLLLPLADNGGPTMTHGLHYQSAAIDAGDGCDVTVDQRYVPRDTFCDVGAFEFTDFTVVTITIDPNVSVKTTGTAMVSGTVRCSRNETENVGMIVSLSQTKKGSPTPVQASRSTAAPCTTATQPWSVTVVPTSGSFSTGTGAATAQTSDTPGWFKPATVSRSVKLVKK